MTAVLCEKKAWVFISPPVCSQLCPQKILLQNSMPPVCSQLHPQKIVPQNSWHTPAKFILPPIGSSGRQCPCLKLLFEIKAAVEQTILHNKLCKVRFHLLRYIRTPQLHSIAHAERNELISMYIFVLFLRLPIHHCDFFRQRWIMSVAPHCKEQHSRNWVSIQ